MPLSPSTTARSTGCLGISFVVLFRVAALKQRLQIPYFSIFFRWRSKMWKLGATMLPWSWPSSS